MMMMMIMMIIIITIDATCILVTRSIDIKQRISK